MTDPISGQIKERQQPAAGQAYDIDRLEWLMNQTPMAMGLMVGEQLEVVAVNDLICEIWGRSREELMNRPLLESMPELRGQGFEEQLLRVLRTEEPFHGKEVEALIKRDGKISAGYYNRVFKPFYDHDRQLIGVLDLAIDVTELVLARRKVELREETLKDHNQKLENSVEQRTEELNIAKQHAVAQHGELQRAFEQAPVAIYVVKGEDYRIELINPMMCEVLDKPVNTCLGRPLFEVFPEAANQGYELLLDQVMITGEPVQFNEHPAELLRKGVKATAYFNFVYQPYADETGKIVGVTAVAVEVTKQLLYQRKLEASEEQFKTMLESMPQLTWTGLPDGRVNYFSQSWYDYTGNNFEQLSDWSWKSIIYPDHYQALFEAYTNSLKTGKGYTNESKIRSASGEFRWFLTRALPLRDANGEIFLWVGTTTDIHELRIAESELQRLSDELADSNRKLNLRNRDLAVSNQQLQLINADLDNFIYTASHDLKAPITNIQGLHSLLRTELPSESNSSVQPLLEMMDRSIHRFMNTIRDLGDIARLQKQHLEEASELDIHELIKDVMLDIAPEIAEAQAEITIDVGECPTLRFSPKNLRSIIYNLLSNAVKYSDPSRALKVNIRCKTDSEHGVLEVSDNGLGMDLASEHKLFTMFYRMHSHVEGSGVGLHIVKKIVDNNKGKIVVVSTPNVGSTFTIFFPK